MVKRNVQLLTCVANEMAPFSLDYTADILHQYMQLFCDTGRLLLLLRLHPSKLTVQLFTLVHSHARLKGKSSSYSNCFLPLRHASLRCAPCLHYQNACRANGKQCQPY